MGIADQFRNTVDKAKDKVDEDKAKEGVDTATDKVDDATDGKYGSYLDKGQDAAKGGVDKLYDDE